MLVLPSPSKLNLFLEVLGKRPDGFHELETVMLRTQFCDMLSASVNSTGRLSLRFSDSTVPSVTAGVPLDERNLILRAAACLRDRFRITAGADFVLHKQIPPQSGLGGGSGNAATALRACRQIWNLTVPDDELHAIAALLGSDINFLLADCRAAVCRGRGEQIEPFALAGPLFFLAFRPDQGNSTPEVFRHSVLPTEFRSSAPLVAALTSGEPAALPEFCFNRLTAAAAVLNPQMANLIERLERISHQPVWMSGSGSTVFLICRSEPHMRQLSRRLREQHIRGWMLRV
ncbi:MAG: 4-(cytidine 5'-diphospho)-2-C-methyl-D-erythritol kinase [Planctomycetaceae bacterium]